MVDNSHLPFPPPSGPLSRGSRFLDRLDMHCLGSLRHRLRALIRNPVVYSVNATTTHTSSPPHRGRPQLPLSAGHRSGREQGACPIHRGYFNPPPLLRMLDVYFRYAKQTNACSASVG